MKIINNIKCVRSTPNKGWTATKEGISLPRRMKALGGIEQLILVLVGAAIVIYSTGGLQPEIAANCFNAGESTIPVKQDYTCLQSASTGFFNVCRYEVSCPSGYSGGYFDINPYSSRFHWNSTGELKQGDDARFDCRTAGGSSTARGSVKITVYSCPLTTPTTAVPRTISIKLPAKGYYTTDEDVVAEIRTTSFSDFDVVSAKLSDPNNKYFTPPPVTADIISNRAVINMSRQPKSIEGYMLTVTAGSTVAIAKVIVKPALKMQLSVPAGTQYTNEPSTVCAKILDENGNELGDFTSKGGDIDTMPRSARYEGESQQLDVVLRPYNGRGSLCPWEFKITALKQGTVIFTATATKTNYESATETVKFSARSAGITVNFLNENGLGTLNMQKTIRFETLNPQGVKIRTSNRVKLCQPDGFTCFCSDDTDQGCPFKSSLKPNEVDTGTYTFAFTPTQIESWTIDITSTAEGLQSGSGIQAIAVSEKPPDDCKATNTCPPSIPPLALIILAGFVISFLIMRRR